ncbi:MAG: DUF1273 domain-containing protein [Oscillospiraceae bacterium]|jgi:uncharacterized phage-like protein YoqJ|nr:DUF1273 domain-containing protein [Oscillospiraceae bacterium]
MKTRKKNTCTISGMRPHKYPPGVDLDALFYALRGSILDAIGAGYTIFQTGMAQGPDIWGGEIVYALRKAHPGIKLHCFQPCETQANNWTDAWRERYFDLLRVADEVYLLQTSYTPDCMLKRNRAMIDKSAKLIAVYDKKTGGGTKYTVDYAKKKDLDIQLINPTDYFLTSR